MKRKIIAIAASILVFSGAGVYAANNGGAAARPVRTAAVTVKDTVSEAAAVPAASGTARKTAQKSEASAAVSHAGNAASGSQSASSCTEAQEEAVSSRKSSGSSAPVSTAPKTEQTKTSESCPTARQAASCTQNTRQLCAVLTGNSTCVSGSNCYSDLLQCLKNNTCGSSAQSGSANCGSKTSGSSSSSSASSQPAASSPASSSGSVSDSYASFRSQVVQLVNQERTSRGLKALSMDSSLTKTATLKSQDMAKLGYFDHTSPTYGSPFDMMKQFGISYRAAGENIAMGQTSPAQVMNGWMNSEGHKANILNTSFTKIGVGVAQNSAGRYYWTQQFIG